VVWFALNEDRPLFAFAGIWTEFKGERGTKSKPIPGPHLVYGFLTDFAERRLITLRHAALYITKLLKTEHDVEWQAAMEAPVLVTKDGGPMLMARIGMMQDAALQIADAVQTRKIGRRPKSPVILFGPELYFD
jgi:hypothetical protein